MTHVDLRLACLGLLNEPGGEGVDTKVLVATHHNHASKKTYT